MKNILFIFMFLSLGPSNITSQSYQINEDVLIGGVNKHKSIKIKSKFKPTLKKKTFNKIRNKFSGYTPEYFTRLYRKIEENKNRKLAGEYRIKNSSKKSSEGFFSCNKPANDNRTNYPLEKRVEGLTRNIQIPINENSKHDKEFQRSRIEEWNDRYARKAR